MTNTISSKKRKMFSMLAHGSAMVSWSGVWVIAPLLLMFCVDDEVVNSNACEALNFGLIAFLLMAVIVTGIVCTFGLGMFLLIPLFPVLLLLHALPIIGMCKVAMNRDAVFYYPLVPRLIRYPRISKSQ
jgi:uncharacterized protein